MTRLPGDDSFPCSVNAFRLNHRTGKTTPVTLSSAKLAAARKDFSAKFSDDFNHKVVAGQTGGAKKWVRNRALGPKEIKSPWSDPALKRVP